MISYDLIKRGGYDTDLFQLGTTDLKIMLNEILGMNKLLLLSFPITVSAEGSCKMQLFSKAKKALERYGYHDHRETIYCSAKLYNKKM